ncbi:hypothetical protein HD806DRAFT_249396 [Xylariaceae sp. AK1471]|nr:hypothetical protein HD806DRAFT_249396 [Xylariaceae sp. AK1471]
MLRRSHKKTKKGTKCEECRRRHIRCDQRRPNCVNCQNADRICTYRDKPAAMSRSGHAPSTSSRASSSTSPPPPPPSQPSQPPPPPLLHSLSSQSPDKTNNSLVNITHLELFNHFVQGTFLFIDRDIALTDLYKKAVISSAFSKPYLMHLILAFSARHLSTQATPERSRYYLDQSTELQTWAVANFDPAPPNPDQEICLALFFFSCLLGNHALADIRLLDLEPEPFFIRFGHYFGLHRGVRAILDDYWSLLESEIQPIMQWYDSIALMKKGRGSECNSIRQLVTQSRGLSPRAAEACYVAIEQLQCVLDECGPHQPLPANYVYMTLGWPLLAPEKIVDLLVLRRPVALIIFAYYGVTLHFCRDLWIVGQAGKHVVHAVNKYLGASWAPWLRWPCEAVGIQTL